MTDPIVRAVERGAAWLDRNEPGWYQKLPVAKLDLGEVEASPLALVRDDPEWDLVFSARQAQELGLLFAISPAEALVATQAWRGQVARRLRSAPLAARKAS